MSRAAVTHSTVEQLHERLTFLVPNFSGYRDPRARRDDDGRLRVEVCERLDRAIVRLEDFLLEVSDEGWSPAVEGIDRSIRALERTREQVAMMTYGKGSLVGPGEPAEPALVRLLDADLTLFVELDELSELLADLGPPHFRDRLLKETLLTIDNRIEAVDSGCVRRYEIARSPVNERAA